MCDTKFSICLYSVRFGIRSLVCGYSGRLYVGYAMQSLGFSVKQVIKEVFGNSSFSRRVTSTASVYFSSCLMVLFLFQCWDFSHLIRVVTRYVFSSLNPFFVRKFLILDSKSVNNFRP